MRVPPVHQARAALMQWNVEWVTGYDTHMKQLFLSESGERQDWIMGMVWMIQMIVSRSRTNLVNINDVHKLIQMGIYVKECERRYA